MTRCPRISMYLFLQKIDLRYFDIHKTLKLVASSSELGVLPQSKKDVPNL